MRKVRAIKRRVRYLRVRLLHRPRFPRILVIVTLRRVGREIITCRHSNSRRNVTIVVASSTTRSLNMVRRRAIVFPRRQDRLFVVLRRRYLIRTSSVHVLFVDFRPYLSIQATPPAGGGDQGYGSSNHASPPRALTGRVTFSSHVDRRRGRRCLMKRCLRDVKGRQDRRRCGSTPRRHSTLLPRHVRRAAHRARDGRRSRATLLRPSSRPVIRHVIRRVATRRHAIHP